jgi:hypothetical protein
MINPKNNLIIKTDLIPNGSKISFLTLFLSTKSNFNTSYSYKFNLSNNESYYNFSNNSLSNTNIFTLGINFLKLSKYNLGIQKILYKNISNNLNLSKQGRWLWKSSLFSEKSIINFSSITHFKKTLSNPKLNVSSKNYNI